MKSKSNSTVVVKDGGMNVSDFQEADFSMIPSHLQLANQIHDFANKRKNTKIEGFIFNFSVWKVISRKKKKKIQSVEIATI